ncbi:Peptide transporter PTR1 [Anopheles sinensis]|uniref:Peptide transporter PTR1 n=1 Tax=Anopheles sinensis TaxID=74873 RepID=A0A084WB06_ANOSI|nr:Peptide transporter PTR1 [Anopheles sinensis]
MSGGRFICSLYSANYPSFVTEANPGSFVVREGEKQSGGHPGATVPAWHRAVMSRRKTRPPGGALRFSEIGSMMPRSFVCLFVCLFVRSSGCADLLPVCGAITCDYEKVDPLRSNGAASISWLPGPRQPGATDHFQTTGDEVAGLMEPHV